MNCLNAGLSAPLPQSTSQSNTVNNYYSVSAPSNYNINDTSGRPDSVARAVDRTMQGILSTA
ncbi:MAG: hypothetical protein FWG65_13150 [Turicibacter sp.]|nr:hypothetical protein [Turicibacter sp.]